MTAVVVHLVFVYGYGRRDSGHLVDLARVAPQGGVLVHVPQVAFEVSVVHGVKSHQRRKQPPVGFRQQIAQQIPVLLQPILQPVQRFE